MNLTVEKMIEQGGFSDFQVLAGASGMGSREVKTVCVIDIVDLTGWLFGGEFLLTSGYIFRDYPEQLGSLIETANEAGAAALGVKTDRYIERIPQEVLQTADRLSFPLIGIPYHYAHTDVIKPVLITIANERARMMDRTEEIRREFFDVLLAGGSIDDILSLLHRHITRDVLFINAHTGERRSFANSAAFAQVAEDAPLASVIGLFAHESIEIAERVRGYLIFDQPPQDPQAEIAVSQAKCALQLHLKWESERAKIERGREAQFVQDILYRRVRGDAEIIGRGRSLGWNLAGRQVAAVLGIDKSRSLHQEPSEPSERAYAVFRSMLRQIQDSVPHANIEDGSAFVLSAPAERWGAVKAGLSEIFSTARRIARQKTGLQLVMGVGAPAESIILCDASFREAKRALALARQGDGASAPVFWEDMGVYKILAPIHNSPDAHDFVQEQLGPLMRNQESLGRDSLLQTLFCIIKNNWQLKPVAATMNLHYNTVKYRYRRIGEILGADLESASARTSLAIAMELHLLNKTEMKGSGVR